MHAYTHGGVAHRQRVSTTFWLRKLSQIFLVLWTGLEPLILESIGSIGLDIRGQRSTNWATTSPVKCLQNCLWWWATNEQADSYLHWESDWTYYIVGRFSPRSQPIFDNIYNIYIYYICVGLAQLVERWTRDLKTRGLKLNPVGSTRTNLWEFFRVNKVMLTHCQCSQPLCVYTCIRMITYAHYRCCSPCQSFGELQKHKKTQHALVGLGSAALAAAVALPR